MRPERVFFKQFKGLEDDFSFDAHSVFSERRKVELALKFTNYNSLPVIRAWGVSPYLDPLIRAMPFKTQQGQGRQRAMKDATTSKSFTRYRSCKRSK